MKEASLKRILYLFAFWFIIVFPIGLMFCYGLGKYDSLKDTLHFTFDQSIWLFPSLLGSFILVVRSIANPEIRLGRRL